MLPKSIPEVCTEQQTSHMPKHHKTTTPDSTFFIKLSTSFLLAINFNLTADSRNKEKNQAAWLEYGC